MSNTPSAAPVSKGRMWLNSLFTALCVSVGYLVVALINQHSVLTIVLSMAAFLIVLTPILYWVNSRRAKQAVPPRRP